MEHQDLEYGTGYSEKESIHISNCISNGNKKYGFFFEHQARFLPNLYKAKKGEGFVVSNCSATGNLYDFGGVRGYDVTFENCTSIPNDRTTRSINFEEFSVRTHVVNCNTNTNFTDIEEGAYYKDAVNWAANNAIATGPEKTLFNPNQAGTRGHVITMLWRMAERPGTVSTIHRNYIYEELDSKYSQIQKAFVEAVIWAQSQYIPINGINGEQSDFNVEAECTRADLITMLWQYAECPIVQTKHSFTDIEEGAVYEEAVNWAVNIGVLDTSSSTFKPENNCTRAQIVTLLYRYANAKDNKYNITYNLNAGRGNPESYISGTNTFTLNNPSKTGYTFNGWTGSNGEMPQKEVSITAENTGNLVYTANWTANSYIIKYDGNGSNEGSVQTSEHTYDMPRILEKNTYSRIGYNFTGWNTKADGTGRAYTDEQVVENLTERNDDEIILYAQWEVIEYNITYNLNGGNVEGNPTKYTIETSNITLKEPTRTNYTFEGWTGSNGIIPQKLVTIAKGSTGDKIYTANWSANTYTIEYNGNGNTGGTTESSTHTYNEESPLRANGFIRTGYKFTGWNTKADGKGTSYRDKQIIKNLATNNEKTITLYAQWTDITAPTITGVEDGKKYKTPITPIIEDENLSIVTLKKDGITITNYKSGDTIKDIGKYVLTAIDTFGNKTIITFEIYFSDAITSEKYTVIEEELIVKNINPRTTMFQLKQEIQTEMEYEIIDRNGVVVLETSYVGTGYKIKMENGKIYTMIIIGDANGDGNQDLRDILTINKHRLNKATLAGIYLQAGDVNEDGKSDLRDILQINKYRLGKINMDS